MSLLHHVEDVGEVHVGCLEHGSKNSVYSHNQTNGTGPYLTLVMCPLCRHCFSPSPRIHCKTVVGSPCPVYRVPEQLGICMDGNTNPCVNLANAAFLGVRACHQADMCGLHKGVSYPLHSVGRTSRKWMFLSFTVLH